MKSVPTPADFAAWSRQAVALLERQIPPDDVLWTDESQQPSLAGLGERVRPPDGLSRSSIRIPGALIEAARGVICHRDPEKWRLLYRILWRLHYETPHLLRIESDPDITRMRRLDQQVRRDAYRMTQFVRFRRVQDDDGDHFIAWHRPDHDVLALAAPFFVKRFARLRWSILTPYRSAYWDRRQLRFADGVPVRDTPAGDELEALWRTYYAAIANPARTNPRAMSAQMPGRFWSTLPEAPEIAPLLARAHGRVATMVEEQPPGAAAMVPSTRELPLLQEAARVCQGCELHEQATQTVFGQGPAPARIMLVGEQPGDEEDRRGAPFVGPAGAVLDRALGEAGLDRAALYLTNAVKHFRFVPAGRARRHQTPCPSHITACRPWLDSELAAVDPELIVCLGATAARSFLGHAVRVMRARGKMLPVPGTSRHLLVTIHPSAVLRAADAAAGEALYRSLVSDLTLAAHHHVASQ